MQRQKKKCLFKRCNACNEGGFTLIEIALVIVIISVMTMMVVPSFFSATGATVGQEARRLAQALRLAADEAVLTGRPVRWSAYAHSYSFESLDDEGHWQMLDEKPYTVYSLPSTISIVRIQPINTFIAEQEKKSKKDAKPVLARLLLLPQGITGPASIVLAGQGSGGEHASVLLRPGPGGISINKGQSG